jgi:dimethylhistidine N-methyltransferase
MLTQAIARSPASDLISEVFAGLTRPDQKELPSKYLYDEVGSALFEVICALPEYGLHRAGARLLARHAEDIVDYLELPVLVAELGSGSGKQTRWLLEALARRQRTVYCPIDISPTALAQSERELSRIDAVSVVGFEQSYLDGLAAAGARRLAGEQLFVLFLGSTIGNFDRPAGEDFLCQVRRILRPGDRLLIATDLVKPVEQLLLAYDDPIGVTAAFNLNLLARLNRELDADFDLGGFRHEARWNHRDRCIEMHLVSRREQVAFVREGAFRIAFSRDESIWTESSHKYDPREVVTLARATGFRCEAQWIDEEWPFAQNLFCAV